MLTICRTVLILLCFIQPVLHLVFLIRARQRREYDGMSRRILHLLASLGWASGMAAVFLLPDGQLAWLAVGLVLLCGAADVRLTLLEASEGRRSAPTGPEGSGETK